ncbi:PAS domain S-box protein [Emticicia sp. 21SJ11W-3]|uniref:PAS domain S-box protein n=1 Tax=Emticicia sp. 21SJ11W-3 TaxID=2916755 RepID=UPI0020A03C44|nr:PAS domain S-box protein [Emticicia sp. 21SJ11W-3]UTA69136.1 PAS domain S-box protein [Emticicia sp. 21SJ11W-3]
MDKDIPVPQNEKERLEALKSYCILDTPSEKEFDRLTKLASVICGVPISIITLLDENRQWFKSNIGLNAPETPRDISFCQYTILGDTVMEVEDATQDNRFRNNPLVLEYPQIRFYAGYPLIDPNGFTLGSLCVIDQKPNKLNDNQLLALEILAQEVISHIVSKKKNAELENYERLFKLSSDLICITGEDKHFKKVNPSFSKILGWTEEELKSKPAIEFLKPDDIEGTKNYISSLTDDSQTISFDNRFSAQDGTYRLINWSVNRDNNSKENFAIGRDITNQRKVEAELIETKNLLEAANRVGRIGSWKLDLETEAVTFSEITREILETNPGIPVTYEDSIVFSKDPQTRSNIEALIDHAIHTGESFDTELEIITANGTPKWIRAMGGIEYKDGQPSFILGTIQDIDKEKHINIEFNKIYTELKAIMDADSGIAIITTHNDGIIKTFNKGAEIMLGYTADEMIGTKRADVFHDHQEVETYAQKVSEELGIQLTSAGEALIAKARLGKTDFNEWTYIRKDGARITVELSLTPLKNSENEISGFLGIAKDITDKKHSERLLQLSEERHRGFFEHSQGLMCTHDLKGKFLTVNPAGAYLLGYSAPEILQKTLYDLVPPEYTERVTAYLRDIHEKGYFKGLMLVQHKDGSLRTWMYNNILSELLGGEKYVIGNAVDITDRINMEQQLIKAKVQAEKNAYAKDVFLANMSHEIRTPMNAIVGFANLLKDSPLTEEQSEYLSYIIIATQNLLGIINDILDLSKIESGHIVIEEVPFSIKDTVKTVKSILQGRANEKGLELTCTIDETIPENVLGDPTRLNQILLNLANNAVKFTSEGLVNIEVQQADCTETEVTILFKITDSGIGIPHDKLSMIFDRFTQANSDTTRKFGGTGLGLSISKSLVELQNGNIFVESKENKGSTFGFLITYKKMAALPEQAPGNSTDTLTTNKEIKVLLVEDNVLNQKLALRVLEKFGFEAELAQNGKIAIEKVKTHKFDIILMDLQMPEMDGYQATVAIREELKDETPIIAMTAHSLVGEKEKCLKIGMNEYITKPFNQRELFDKVVKFA